MLFPAMRGRCRAAPGEATRLAFSFLLATLLLGAAPVAASGPAADRSSVAPYASRDAGRAPSRLWFSAGFDATTQLSRHGDAARYRHLVVEPWAEVGFRVWERPESWAIQSLELALGWWRQDHEEWTGVRYSGRRRWYDADFYGAVSLRLLHRLELRATFTRPDTPELAYAGAREREVSLTFDDGPLWEELGLDLAGFQGFRPYASIYRDRYRVAEEGGSRKHRGRYFELGAEPAFAPFEHPWLEPLLVVVPLRLGFGDDGYSELSRDPPPASRDYRSVEAGLVVRYPLLSRVEVYAGASYLRASHSLGHGSELAGRFGVVFAF